MRVHVTVICSAICRPRFWLFDCQSFTEVSRMATELYRELVAVPFFCKFLVFAKRRDLVEARLCVVSTTATDDRSDKTFETQEHFTEVARSKDVEVFLRLFNKPLCFIIPWYKIFKNLKNGNSYRSVISHCNEKQIIS